YLYISCILRLLPLLSSLFPYTRSSDLEYGDDMVQFLRGMFAFAIWDEKRRRLFLARDRVGIKPLYYAGLEGVFLFGSEIKAMLRSEEHTSELQSRVDLVCRLLLEKKKT